MRRALSRETTKPPAQLTADPFNRRLTLREHEVAYQDLIALLNKHAGSLPASEMLAIAANMLGKLIALQDQRTMTRERALEIIMKNIEEGNSQVIDNVTNTKGNA